MTLAAPLAGPSARFMARNVATLEQGAQWSPLSLGASLLAWWTAERADLMTLSGAQVSSWRDVVAGYDAAQATGTRRPTYSATSFGGGPGLTFDGVDDYLFATQPGVFPVDASPCEMWVLMQQDSLAEATATTLILQYGGTDGFLRRRSLERAVISGVSRAQGTVGDGSTRAFPTVSSVDLSSRHVLRLEVAATESRLSVDNSAAATVAFVPATAAMRVAIGATLIGTSPLNGKIAEVLVTGALTDAQAAALWSYLMPKRRV
ncbi:MAG: hypothetical protein HC900_00310 [Methylacidiphilales bacterium]|nr:hypothetical protein [Candidatus Methylacidiphilales bacterium]